MIRRRVLVTGQVQGVGFRWFAKMNAARLGLTGWVRNLSGGGVELEIQGGEGAVEQMLQALAQGPHFAQVDEVRASPRPLEEERGFQVRMDR